jgi:hypothetical protein
MSEIELMELIAEETVYIREWRDSLTIEQINSI